MITEPQPANLRLENWWGTPGQAQPFLKWVGGKGWLLPTIARLIPDSFRAYHEPFLGGGAVFFHIAPWVKRAYLSDSTPELIHTYQALQQDAERVISLLAEHADKDCAEHYNWTHMQPPEDIFEVAARMIYLNRTCFSGVHRVNKNGHFNTARDAWEILWGDAVRFLVA